jgi:bacterioferritin-associated ferredoxin
MYVCVCNSVTNTDIRNAVDDGVRNLRQLRVATGCSTGCGKCLDMARQELNQALAQKRSFLQIVPSSAVA